jgi:hypothetical protein
VSSNIPIPTEQQRRHLLDPWRKQCAIDEEGAVLDVIDVPSQEEYECVILPSNHHLSDFGIIFCFMAIQMRIFYLPHNFS